VGLGRHRRLVGDSAAAGWKVAVGTALGIAVALLAVLLQTLVGSA
jgi:hypothetical protein